MQYYTWKRFLKDYWYLLSGRRRLFVIYTILRIIADLIPFAIAYILGRIIDFFTSYQRGQQLTLFYYYIAAMAILGAFEIWLRFFSKVRLQTMAADIRRESRINAVNRIITLDIKWHETEETGSKIQRINQGGESIFQGIKEFSNEGVYILTGLIGSMILFLTLDARYALFAVGFLILYLSGELYYSRKLSNMQYQLMKVKEKVSGKLHESSSNILAVKSMGLGDSIGKSTASYEDEFYDVWVKTRDISQKKFRTVKMFSSVTYALFILMLGLDFTKGLITLGSIYVFASYFNKLKDASHEITNHMNDFIAVQSSVGRFMALFDIEQESEKGLRDFPSGWNTIEFRDVTFRYKNKDVLKGFNLKIRKGEKIGIAGESGCGKSTIVKLLLKLYKPSSGMILVDGNDLNSFKQTTIATSLGVVLQEPEMFNLSVSENISISSPDFDMKRFEESSRVAQLEQVIRKLPKGMDTQIGEKGYQLSGGERQRIGIARAIYKNSEFLVLDEATSALDTKTEEKVQNGLNRLNGGRTMLIVAHRLSTLKSAGKILLMEKGKVVESGTFGELIKKKGKFYRLYRNKSSR